MTSITEEMDERISTVVTKQVETVNKLGKEAAKSLEQSSSQLVSSAASEIVSLSQESFSELEASYEFSHQELSDKLTELRNQTEQLLLQVKDSLNEMEATTKAGGDKIAQELKQRPAAVPAENAATRNPVEDIIRQLSRELDLSSSDLKRQLNELLKIQSERLANLSSAAENSISGTAASLNSELKQITRLQQQTWTEREQELLARLRKMEKETEETYAMVSDNSGDAPANGSV
jgi:hypothetical protein